MTSDESRDPGQVPPVSVLKPFGFWQDFSVSVVSLVKRIAA